ncbi:arsenosugar biosynthesis radical SAM (seleno)protein ArsS [Pseudomarimonas arenosa]|uniref:Arsenosugar biosynthesis radical SAM protein ArsS n=1 Tax=Pseudomarimonas arenosa TaxID=2774145 RepID=A0AAW3ZE31_9GAMM|nr:arsenosugar biosynthesis radical SAM (seleno)protein ArsS [Pseudomarimonas arenosa]MBD8524458.1 arsenosugar biosynthesis radical SAM protein ArsS [Pseudomarimonas arenosa]
MRDTLPLLEPSDFPSLERRALGTLQLNLGYLCNLSCIHCHVNAGPHRTELMERDIMQLALDVAQRHGVRQLDLTGGSPEMNPEFRWLVQQARSTGIAVMDRLNPTIIEEPGYEWVAEFLAAQQVEIVASLPCYSAANVDEQRGDGVFESSIRALQRLNALGYGQPGSSLVLNLVYNPNGAFLPPPQAALEADYKRLLQEQFGIIFNQLFALANMPIKRFGSWLLSKGRFESYMGTLRSAHRNENLNSVMCRDLLSIDWRGYVYDCDFNQMLGLPAGEADSPLHLRDLLHGEVPTRIRVAGHCYGCTAGQGSSCGGALAI